MMLMLINKFLNYLVQSYWNEQMSVLDKQDQARPDRSGKFDGLVLSVQDTHFFIPVMNQAHPYSANVIYEWSYSEASSAEAKSEIEVADFDRLLSKIENLNMRSSLKELLVKIKDSGLTKMEQSNKGGGHILTRRRSKFQFI